MNFKVPIPPSLRPNAPQRQIPPTPIPQMAPILNGQSLMSLNQTPWTMGPPRRNDDQPSLFRRFPPQGYHLVQSTPLPSRQGMSSRMGHGFDFPVDNQSVYSVSSVNRDADWERAFQHYMEISGTQHNRELAIQIFNGIKQVLETTTNGSMHSFRSGAGWRSQYGGSIRSEMSQSSIGSLFSGAAKPRIGQAIKEKNQTYVMEAHTDSRAGVSRHMQTLDSTIKISRRTIVKRKTTHEPAATTRSDIENETPSSPTPQTVKKLLIRAPDVATVNKSKTPKRKTVIRNTTPSRKRKASPVSRKPLLTLDKTQKGAAASSSQGKALQRRGKNAKPLAETVTSSSQEKPALKPAPSRRKPPAKYDANVPKEAVVSSSSNVDLPKTRSGRTIKPPGEYWQGYASPAKKPRDRSPSIARAVPESTTRGRSRGRAKKDATKPPDIDEVSDTPPEANNKRNRGRSKKEPAKPAKKETAPAACTLKVVAPAKARSKKAQVSPSLKVPPRTKAVKKPSKPKKENPDSNKSLKQGNRKGKGASKAKENEVVDNALNDSAFGDLSGGMSLFIPEINTCKGRGGVKRRFANALSAQTPPLHYYMNNLQPSFRNTATPTQTTPADWMFSQRTQSEARDFAKRKVQPKKKKEPVKKTAAVKPKAKKPAKLLLAAISPSMQRGLRNPIRCSDSESESE